jgi:drug/metabolite transporter (DMT)-like permease
MFFVVLLYALFASVFTIAKIGLGYTQPIFFVGSRMLLAGILMLAYHFLIRREKMIFNKSILWRLFLLGLFNIFLTNMFEFWALKYLTSFKTCFIYSLSPFLSALFSYFIFSEILTLKKWIGLIIGFIGLFPILLAQTEEENAVGHLLFLSWPELAMLSAVVCSVYGWILLRQCVNRDGNSPIVANGMSMAIGGTMALAQSYCLENWDPIPVTEFVPFLECAILLIIISNLICYNLYGYLLRRYSATFMSFAGFTTPIFTAIFGWLVLSESVGVSFYLSLVVVFCGLFIFYFEELKESYAVESKTAPIDG